MDAISADVFGAAGRYASLEKHQGAPIIGRVTGPGREQRPEVVGIARSGRNAVLQLAVRTGVLRAITFVGTILLARALRPEDYGIFAVVIFLVGVLTPLGDLGLGSALIQKRERPTDAEIGSVFTVQVLSWAVLAAVFWVLAPLVHLVGSMPADAEWMIRVTAVAVFIGHLSAVPAAMMSRVLRFGPLAASEVVQQVIYVVVALTLALNGAGAWAIILAVLVQFSVGTVIAFVAWGRLPRIGIDRAALRPLLGFGVTVQATIMLGLLRESVVPVFGGLAGGVPAIGHLHFGQRLGRLVGGVEEVAARVAFPAFSRLQDDRERLSRALVYVVETTALGLGMIMCWTIAVAPTLVSILFSDRWAPAVPVFQLMAAASLLAPQAHFLRGLALSAGRARSLLLWSAVCGVAIVVAFPFLVMWLGLLGGGLGFLGYAVLQLYGYWHATTSVASFPWAAMLRIYLIGAVAGVAAAVTLLFLHGLAGLIVSGLVFMAAYLGLCLVFERPQLSHAWQLLRSGTVPDSD